VIESKKNYIISLHASLKDTIKILEKNKNKCLIVSNKKFLLFGTITDGDIRRAILKGANFNSSINKFYNSNPFVIKKKSKDSILTNLDKAKLKSKLKYDMYDVTVIPVVNLQNKIVDIITKDDIFKKKIIDHNVLKNTPVVIMAGGQGVRLKPATYILPKPLMPINNKSVIEIIIDNFRQYGVNKFIISVNYKTRLLKSFFKELKPKYKVFFLDENKPLGTVGALSKLRNKLKTDCIISNCDVIFNIDYIALYNFHKIGNFDLTLVASEKTQQIPYGSCVINKQGLLKKIVEKPKLNYLANVGLYFVKSKVLKIIPKDKKFDVNELINKMKKRKMKVGVFPVGNDAWHDIGNWTSYNETLKLFDIKQDELNQPVEKPPSK